MFAHGCRAARARGLSGALIRWLLCLARGLSEKPQADTQLPASCHYSAAAKCAPSPRLSEARGFLPGHHRPRGWRPLTVSGSTRLGGGLPEPGGEIWAAQPRWRAARRRLMRAGTAGGEGSSPPHWPPPPLTHPAPRPSSPAPNPPPLSRLRAPTSSPGLPTPSEPPLHLQAASLIAF